MPQVAMMDITISYACAVLIRQSQIFSVCFVKVQFFCFVFVTLR